MKKALQNSALVLGTMFIIFVGCKLAAHLTFGLSFSEVVSNFVSNF